MSLYREDRPVLDFDYGDWEKGMVFLMAMAQKRHEGEVPSDEEFLMEKSLKLLMDLKLSRIAGFIVRPYGRFGFMLWDRYGHMAYHGHDSHTWTPVFEWHNLRDKLPRYTEDASATTNLCQRMDMNIHIICSEALWMVSSVEFADGFPEYKVLRKLKHTAASYSLGLALSYLLLAHDSEPKEDKHVD